jgi:hypothetical protein
VERETGAKARKPAPKRRFKPEAARAPAPKRQPQKEELSEGLRLLTTQMSVAGAPREEIAERLRDEFAIKDPERILKAMGL